MGTGVTGDWDPRDRPDPRNRSQPSSTPGSNAYYSAQYGSMAHGQGIPVTDAARQAFINAMRGQTAGGGGAVGYGGGGGGGGRGGYGGGGGMPQMTQAQFDQMLAVLAAGAQGPQYAPFQGQNINPFQGQMYQGMQTQLGQAVNRDRANVEQVNAQTAQQLQQNYQNPYAQLQPVAAPAPSTVGAGLVDPGALQGGADQQQIENQNSLAAFQGVQGTLAAASDQSQRSRQHQLGLDRQTALNSIGAQQMGLGAQINMARQQAYEEWIRRDEERRYQNSLAQQQSQNQQAQAQYDARSSILQPLLDLLGSTTGNRNLNMDALTKLLAGLQ